MCLLSLSAKVQKSTTESVVFMNLMIFQACELYYPRADMKWAGHKIKMGKAVELHMECDSPLFPKSVDVILAVVLPPCRQKKPGDACQTFLAPTMSKSCATMYKPKEVQYFYHCINWFNLVKETRIIHKILISFTSSLCNVANQKGLLNTIVTFM